MKKMMLMLALLVTAVVAFFFFFFTPDRLTPENPAGKTIYYTVVDNTPFQQNADGRYEYELASYDKQGGEKKLSFTASKPLREGACLELYTAAFRGVTYWQEVPFTDLPSAVQQIVKK